MAMLGKVKFKIRGVSPLILNNGHTADPLNEYAQRLKKLNSKRDKTEADYEKISREEWESCFYLDDDKKLIMPGDCIEAMLYAAAAKTKGTTKKDLQAGAWVEGDAPLVTEMDGMSFDDAWKDGKFAFRKRVRIMRAQIVRTRPIFFKWSLGFTVTFLEDILSKDRIIDLMNMSSYRIGMGDWRPKFGRFEILTTS